MMMRKKSDGLVLLNLGCGATLPPDWIGYDISLNVLFGKIPGFRTFLNKLGLLSSEQLHVRWPLNVRWKNLCSGIPHKDNSVDTIYMSHFLEHLSRSDGSRLLGECFRVLKPMGIIRVAVPDLGEFVGWYIAENASWVPNPSAEHAPADKLIASLGLAKQKAKNRNPHSHKYAYDKNSLKLLLEKKGFIFSEQKKFRESNVQDIHEVEFRKGGLFMEARKPSDE